MSVQHPPQQLTNIRLITYHCQKISHQFHSVKATPEKRAAAAILRGIADVFDEIHPVPAPRSVPPYEEILRLSVPPSHTETNTNHTHANSELVYNGSYTSRDCLDRGSSIALSPSRKRGFLSATSDVQLSPKRAKHNRVSSTNKFVSSPVATGESSPRVNTTNDQLGSLQELSNGTGEQKAPKPKYNTDRSYPLPESAKEEDDTLFIPEQPAPDLDHEARNTELQVQALQSQPQNSHPSIPAARDQNYDALSDEVAAKTARPSPTPTAAKPVNPTTNAPEDSILTTKPRRRVTRSTSLKDITYSIDKETRCDEIVACRDQFFQRLCGLEVDVFISGVKQTRSFSETEATNVTNLLFTDLIGWPAMKRVQDLLTEYCERPEHCAGLEGIARADQIARAESTPQPFRDLFGSLSRGNRHTLHGIGSKQGPVYYNTIKSLIESVKIHQTYTSVMTRAEENDPDVARFLLSHGYRDKKLKAAARLFIRNIMGYSQATLELQIQQHEIVAFMVQLFGNGIIPIFPVHAIWTLRKWGLQRMKAALRLYHEIFPKLALVCGVLETYVYQPIADSSPIPMVSGSLSANVPLVELINSAVVCTRYPTPSTPVNSHPAYDVADNHTAYASQASTTVPSVQVLQSIVI